MSTQYAFFAIDIEFEQPNMEILSVGLAYQGLPEKDIAMSKENFLITPSSPVSDFIQNLTGLTNDRFDFQQTRAECYRAMVEHHQRMREKYSKAGVNLFKEAVSWGQGESKLLKDDLKKYDLDAGISDRVIDLKTLLMMERLHKGQSISAKMSLRTGLKENKVETEGKPHDSGWDAWNTLRLFDAYCRRNNGIRQLVVQLSNLV